MPESARQALEQEGIVIGATLTVEKRVGMGGPVIVGLGRARVAIARAVARTVIVTAVAPEDEAAAGDDGTPREVP